MFIIRKNQIAYMNELKLTVDLSCSHNYKVKIRLLAQFKFFSVNLLLII